MRALLGALLFVPACSSSAATHGAGSSPPAPPSLSSSVEPANALPIPARRQALESPAAGWCGETAIQEALLHFGVWAPQRLINKAGRPAHPDLYSGDLPVALTELGVRFTFYSPRARGFDGFARWVAAALDEGDPVLAGLKILPTQHPEWDVDHFALVVAHRPGALLVNTTWGTREWVGDTTTPGLSFKNPSLAIRLRGVSLPPGARAARLGIVAEEAAVVKLRVTCPAQPDRIESVDATRVVRFRCPGGAT